MSRLAWWDCGSGASGDMVLGALVDAGLPVAELQAAVDATGIGPVKLRSDRVRRGGIAATQLHVDTAGDLPHRTWPQIRELLVGAGLSEPVRTLALGIFGRLAAAEAVVHDVPPEQVTFHEVGGWDTVADVVGAATGLVWLGADRHLASTVTVGSGTVRTAHGTLPVPAPATVEILRAAGAVVQAGPVAAEMCTPTGAAIMAETVTGWTALPPLRMQTVGVGAGSRDDPDRPNAIRLFVGEPVEEPADAVVLAANVDDLDPRVWPTVLDRLLAAGASDAWLTPIVMKKGRPAHTLQVLVPTADVPAVRAVVFRETSTIGLRELTVRKHALDRHETTVDVSGQPVRVKVATDGGRVVNATPEYDDVLAAAIALDRPVRLVLAAAVAAAQATTRA